MMGKRRCCLVALGVALVVSVYIASLAMFRYANYLDERRMRTCLESIERSLEANRGAEVTRALNAYLARSNSANAEQRYELCNQLDAIAYGRGATGR